MSPLNPYASHNQNQNHHQLVVPSLSRLFGTDGRYQFYDGQRASIVVIKQLSDDGVWLIGFQGRALRARSTVPLARGARLPVMLFVEQDTLVLRIAGAARGSAIRHPSPSAAGSGAELERAIMILAHKGFSRDLPALAQLLLHGRADQHEYYGDGDHSAHKQSVGDDGRRNGAHQQQRDEREGRRKSDDDEREHKSHTGASVSSVGDRERLLTLFNLLSADGDGGDGDDDCWRVVPFEISEPSIYGTIRLRIRVASGTADEAVVVVDRSDFARCRWAIAVRALGTAHPRVTMYAAGESLLHDLQQLQQRLARLLQPAGVREVAVKRWDHAFDGFGEEERAVSRGVNINV